METAQPDDVNEPLDEATYAIGDLHGEAELLRQVLALIMPRPQDTLVFLGDYLDRGPDAQGVCETLLALSRTHHCIFLRGNHDEDWLEMWNGEHFTRPAVAPGARRVWEQYHGAVPPVIGRLLAKTQMTYEDGYAWYSHAGAEPGVPFWQSSPEVYVWGMQGFITSPYDWGKPVVFGHYEFEEPLITHTKIGLDTGAYRTGVLTAMRLQDRQIFQARRAPAQG
ncbi:MAG TPA: metallophosphoesterase [Ktedonobacterales bacterium]|nr:metallophosphoesterase [Ktedonobacterales bacterium]